MIEQNAPGLRRAGVIAVSIDGDRVSFQLDSSPPQHESAGHPADPPTPAAGPEISDPLDDPATFGGELPGYEFEDE